MLFLPRTWQPKFWAGTHDLNPILMPWWGDVLWQRWCMSPPSWCYVIWQGRKDFTNVTTVSNQLTLIMKREIILGGPDLISSVSFKRGLGPSLSQRLSLITSQEQAILCSIASRERIRPTTTWAWKGTKIFSELINVLLSAIKSVLMGYTHQQKIKPSSVQTVW